MGALSFMKSGQKGKPEKGSYFTDKGNGNGKPKPKPKLSFFKRVKKDVRTSRQDVQNRDKWKEYTKKRFKERPEDKSIKKYYQGWKKKRPTGLKTMERSAKRYGSRSDVARGFGKRYGSVLPRRQPSNERERGTYKTVTRYSDRGRTTVRTYKPRKQNNNNGPFGSGYSYNFFDTSLV